MREDVQPYTRGVTQDRQNKANMDIILSNQMHKN